MARSFIIVLGTLTLVTLTSACSSGSSGGGGESNIPSSKSGRPFGLDISDNMEVYPNYDSEREAAGLALEVRPNSKTDVLLTTGVAVEDILGFNFRPQADLEVEHRPNDRLQLNVGAGVGPNGQPRGHIRVETRPNEKMTWTMGANVDSNGQPQANFGAELRPNDNVKVNLGAGVDSSGQPQGEVALSYQYRRRRSAETASLDEETSRILFQVFDLNRDEKVDVDDWSKEGGKILSFAGMIETYDTDGDEKMSLQEFLQVPLLPNLGLDLDQVGLVQEPAPEPEQD